MNALVLLRSVHRSPGADETLPGLGPCDRAALHTALELAGDDEVTAVTAGPSADEECLRCALALGASRAVRLWDAFLDSDDLHALAAVLAAGVQRLPFDVVLAGHRSADWASGATGPAIAHILGVPHVTAVVAARRRDGVLEVDQLRDEGILALDVEPPALR
jgi:electron transfer flavoprotein beta subunit